MNVQFLLTPEMVGALLGLSLPVEHSHTVGECRQGNLERGTLRVCKTYGNPVASIF